ncbi:MAG: hypothetical protein EPN25_06460 [Nitrospirae bacterium]|nr:MAG: hypothetical protein EPN25_06460 [Nitrospirota bacterium]
MALANPTVGPPDPASAFIFPIIAEIGVVMYLLRNLSCNKFRLAGALVLLHSITYPAFLFGTASLKGSSVGGFAVLIGELIVVLVEGSGIYLISRFKWIGPYSSGRLSYKRAIVVSTIGNICSFVVPIVALFFSPFLVAVLLSLPFTLPIYLFLIFFYLRQKPFIKAWPQRKRMVFVAAFLSAVVICSLYSYNRLTSFSPPYSHERDKTCSLSDEEAVSKVHGLMGKLNIRYDTAPIVEDKSLSNVDYPGIRKFKDVRFEYPNREMKGRFYVGCESREVEHFDNFEAKKKNATAVVSNKSLDYKSVIESLAKKIGIPSDMLFDKVDRDWRKDIWEGRFVRAKDEYRYEMDFVSIGVYPKTGELAKYNKVYFGQNCPTDVNIQKDKAMKTAESAFHKFIYGKIRERAHELYSHDAKLLIIQPDRPTHGLSVGQIDNLPLKERTSRLAWVVRFYFTGGISYPNGTKSVPDINSPDRKAYEMTFNTRRHLLRNLGSPLQSFEIRIDAGNGEILYVSEKDSLKYFYRWLLPEYLLI